MERDGVRLKVSLGSAVVLGLREARMDVRPTTLYAMLGERCHGACRFCAQARDSDADPRFLSRVVWPQFDLDAVLARLPESNDLRRICIQTVLAPGSESNLVAVAEAFHAVSKLPISVCMNPTDPAWLPRLRAAGVDRVGVGLDCATEETFSRIKPGFHWEAYHTFLDAIVDTFGTGSVHLIVGLGDSDEDVIRKIQDAHDRRCTVALFAFTPVRGAKLDLPAPEVGRYRALQLARYLIISGRARLHDMVFIEGRLAEIRLDPVAIERALDTGLPFRTSGCPDCNRPLYNERPGGVMYNYAAPLTEDERGLARQELLSYIGIQAGIR
ncbi:MAG: radical SAM protein [Anaerolineae bacterium]|nr:radical SAM protein [Anaerolineae bacterium]